MYLQFEEIKSTAYSDMVMEDCIAYDLGIVYTKEEKAIILAKKLFHENWRSFNIVAQPTMDGLHVGNPKAVYEDDDYCLIYVSFLKIISGDIIIQCETELEMWDKINDIVANRLGIEL